MRRYVYSNSLRITFNILVMFVFIPSLAYFVCSLIFDKCLNIPSLILIISCFLFWLISKLVIFILNKKAKNSVVFTKEKIVYKNRTIYINDVSIKYFKLYISVIYRVLLIPKVLINGTNISITCYLSKRDVKALKKMNYEIKELIIDPEDSNDE